MPALVPYALLALTACWTPRETGPRTMVGRILDPSGAPLAGLSVETIESRWVTDDQGRFAVSYKEPSQWVGFTHDDAWIRRSWRPSDNGTDVEIRVPALERRPFVCELAEPCDAVLTWELPDEGLTVEARARCDRNEKVSVAGPPGRPSSVACRSGSTEADVRLHEADGALQMEPPPVALSVHLVTDDLPLPEACRVEVDGEAATPTDPGTWEALVFGTVTVRAWCDGVPVTPRRVYVRDPFRLDVVWKRHTPTLDLSEQLPWATKLVVAAVGGLEHGWWLVLSRGEDGRFVLPPLEAGAYGIGVGLAHERVLGIHPAEGVETGVVKLTETPSDLVTDGTRGAAGVLVLDAPAAPGPLTSILLPWE